MATSSLLEVSQMCDDCLYTDTPAEGPCTLRNRVFDPFSAFPGFSGFLVNSGGPTLPS